MEKSEIPDIIQRVGIEWIADLARGHSRFRRTQTLLPNEDFFPKELSGGAQFLPTSSFAAVGWYALDTMASCIEGNLHALSGGSVETSKTRYAERILAFIDIPKQAYGPEIRP